MTTRKDYILMAKWISDNSSSDSEWAHVRDPLIKFACYIATESDKLRGNQKLFDRQRFLAAIVHNDEAAAMVEEK